MITPVVKGKDIKFEFKEGFSKVKVLDSCHEYVHLYKCILKAGCIKTLELHNDRFEVFAFVRGTGSIITPSKSYCVSSRESTYFIPNFNNERVDLHAGSDLEFVLFETIHTEADKIRFNDTHMWLPYFRTASDLFRYDQSCKGPNTMSYSVIPSKMLGRVLMGLVISFGEGTVEKGHPSVHQWNYMLPGTKLTAEVDGEKFKMMDGDFSFVAAGLDHSHVAAPGDVGNYLWFEWFVDPLLVTEGIILNEYSASY